MITHFLLEDSRRRALDRREHEDAPDARLTPVFARGPTARAKTIRNDAAPELAQLVGAMRPPVLRDGVLPES